MATADDYAAWIVANQSKKGTPEFETVAKAYQLAKSEKTQKAEPKTFDPTEGMSTTEKFLAGAGKAFVDAGRGVGQLVGLVDRKDIDEAKKLDAPLMNTGAGTVGNIVGNVAAYAPLAVIPGANTIAGGALVGAGAGALQPVGTDDSRLNNAAIGAAAGGVVPAALKAGKVAKAALIDPFTAAGQQRIVGGALNRSAADPLQAAANMRSATAATPGFSPTAGQAANDAGIASVERAARAIDPAGFDMVDKSQRAALANALLDIAQTPEARAAAVNARADTARTLYQEALDPANQQALTPWLKGQITQLVQRPSINEASKTAQRWAMERGEKPSANGSLPALHDVKQALDDMIGQAKREGKGGEVAALTNTKEQLLNVMDKLSPKYEQARTSYASMSRPINQMDIGRELYNRFEPALSQASTYPFKTTADSLARALMRGDDLAANVTGMSGAKLSSILEPEQLAKVQGVVKDAAMRAAAENAGRGVGSDTVQKMAMSNLIAESGLPSWIQSIGRVPGGWLKTAGDILYSKNDETLRHLLADMLKNPQAAAQAMEKAGMKPSQAMELMRIGMQAPMLSVPASANAAQ